MCGRQADHLDRAGQADGGHITRVRPTAHHVRRAHQDFHVQRLAALRRFKRSGEFGGGHAVARRLFNMGQRRVVMAGGGRADEGFVKGWEAA